LYLRASYGRIIVINISKTVLCQKLNQFEAKKQRVKKELNDSTHNMTTTGCNWTNNSRCFLCVDHASV